VRGFRVKTIGKVMKRPPSASQHFKIGMSNNENSPSRLTTSWHGPDFTSRGKYLPNSASFGNIFTFSSKPSGDLKSSHSVKRAATSSTLDTSSASSIRLRLPKALIKTGISPPSTFSNNRALLSSFDLDTRSVISVISWSLETGTVTRLSSLFFSKTLMNSRRSEYAI
jgi:hypothetical protein